MYNETLKQHTLSDAKRFNSRNAGKLIISKIPALAVDAYPGLGHPYYSDKFSSAVFSVQRDLGLMEDGKLGRGTWGAILQEYDTVDVTSDYIVFGGRRISLPDRDTYRVVAFDGMVDYVGIDGEIEPLDLHQEGHFSRRKTPIDKVIMHWGGLDPKHLHAVMSSPDRAVSTHFGIGLLDGEPVVIQYLDLKHKAWHAGWGNEGSVGIDICQQPTYKWVGHYQKRGYSVKRKDNPTDRGNRKILSLEPRIAEATRDFVIDLMEALGLRCISPDTHGVLDKGDIQNGVYTLVGHHHLVGKKWDIACWWGDIFEGTDLEV
jgi:hypothetical protein